MSIQRKISKARNKLYRGQEVSVLVEGPSPDTDLLWQARMSTQAPEIDGYVLINDVEGEAPAAGQMRRLLITETHDYDVIGTLLPSTEVTAAFRPTPLIQISSSRSSELVSAPR